MKKDLSKFKGLAAKPHEEQFDDAFKDYESSEYTAKEMHRLLRITLTHSANLVHQIEKDSPEAQFLKKNFGIDYPIEENALDQQLPEKQAEPEPILNTLKHSFNASSMKGSGVSLEKQKNADMLSQHSQIARNVISHKYDSFAQILDDLFPKWDQNKDLTLPQRQQNKLQAPKDDPEFLGYDL